MPNMRSENHQIVIVGAGPGGCSTALWLARLCPRLVERTVILEKYRHPRPKVCAGGLTTRALRMLAEMGLSLNIPHAKIDHVRLLFENHSAEMARRDCMRVVKREQFDAMLADAVRAAGFELHEDEEALEAGFARDSCRVKTSKARYDAGVVVGADGSRGLTHRCLPGYGRYPLVGLAVDTPVAPGDGDDLAKGRITIDFTCNASGAAGYMWHFPFRDGKERGCNHGIFCSLKESTNRGNAAKLLREGLRARGVDRGGRIRGGCGGGYHPRRRLSRPHLLLVGDAAGGNALTGEGIAQALMYGRLAAEEIARAFLRNDFSFRFYTARVAHSELGRNMLGSLRIAKSFYPGGPAVAVPSIAADAALREQVADFISGTDARTSQRGISTRMLAGCILHGAPDPRTMLKILKRFIWKTAQF